MTITCSKTTHLIIVTSLTYSHFHRSYSVCGRIACRRGLQFAVMTVICRRTTPTIIITFHTCSKVHISIVIMGTRFETSSLMFILFKFLKPLLDTVHLKNIDSLNKGGNFLVVATGTLCVTRKRRHTTLIDTCKLSILHLIIPFKFFDAIFKLNSVWLGMSKLFHFIRNFPFTFANVFFSLAKILLLLIQNYGFCIITLIRLIDILLPLDWSDGTRLSWSFLLGFCLLDFLVISGCTIFSWASWSVHSLPFLLKITIILGAQNTWVIMSSSSACSNSIIIRLTRWFGDNFGQYRKTAVIFMHKVLTLV